MLFELFGHGRALRVDSSPRAPPFRGYWRRVILFVNNLFVPELPEVETIKRQLNERLVNKRIISVEVITLAVNFQERLSFVDQLKDRKIIAI